MHGQVGQAMTIAQADRDGDGRISEAEFVASRLPIFAGRGVPANWRGAKATADPAAEARMSDEHGQTVAARKVGMDEAAAFEREQFGFKDTDRSGFLDPREASAMEPRDSSRDKQLSAAPPAGQADPAAERKWMAKLDTDRDGRVSQEEYVSYMLPWTLWAGVPAFWHPGAAGAAGR